LNAVAEKDFVVVKRGKGEIFFDEALDRLPEPEGI
jgi:hypothetical protein